MDKELYIPCISMNRDELALKFTLALVANPAAFESALWDDIVENGYALADEFIEEMQVESLEQDSQDR